MPDSFKEFLIILIILSVVNFASLPPFKITPFPDLIQSAATSEATLGLDSKITAIRPNGTVTFEILRPLGLILVSKIIPRGSFNLAMLIISSHMLIILLSFNSNLSSKCLGRFSSFAFSRSLLFCIKI